MEVFNKGWKYQLNEGLPILPYRVYRDGKWDKTNSSITGSDVLVYIGKLTLYNVLCNIFEMKIGAQITKVAISETLSNRRLYDPANVKDERYQPVSGF